MEKASRGSGSGGWLLAAAFTFAITLLLSACTPQDRAHEHETYTCPMHPTVVSDRPATCPVCGMDLVRKARPGEELVITEDLSWLLKSPNEVVIGSAETVRGEFKSMPFAITARGVVAYDSRRIFTISARVAGRLERVYLKHAFQPVSRGQKIAEIYSPELVTAQREFLFVWENDNGDSSLVTSARRKLELLGMTTHQIRELIRTKGVSQTIAIYSPHSGYLIAVQQAQATGMNTGASPNKPNTAGMQDGMGSRTTPTSAAQQQEGAGTELSVREGDYVNAGQSLFTIVDNAALRIELEVAGAHSGRVNVGDNADVNFSDHKTLRGTVDLIQPYFTNGEDFLKVRIYPRETKGLYIGQLVTAEIHVNDKEALWVPRKAVMDLGVQKVVFLKDRGVFKPKAVTTGISSHGVIEIKSGLASADEIAANAQLMVDSESFVKPIK